MPDAVVEPARAIEQVQQGKRQIMQGFIVAGVSIFLVDPVTVIAGRFRRHVALAHRALHQQP